MTLLLNPGPSSGGQPVRSVTKSGEEVQVVTLDLGGAGAEALLSGSIPVTGTFFQATQPVSGTFWQATQPVSFTWAGLTDAQLRASAVPVSLASTEISNFPATQAVTGTFWQATQPVSAASLPLPSGAATETTLAAIDEDTAVIAGAIRAEDSAHSTGHTGIMALAVRADSEASLGGADGDYSPLQVNEVGRLKVSAQPGLYALVTGNITANSQTVFCQVDRASNVMLHMVAASLVGHNVTFEGSINSTNGTDGAWFGIQAVRSNANTIETATGVLAATPAYAWEASVNGLSFVRVRATAHTSGTATWNIQRGSYATEPIPAAQTHAISALPAGTALVGDVGVQVRANATGAASIHHIVAAGSTNVAQIKATAGRVYGYCLSNTTASWRYVKLHNVAAATAGAAVALTIGIPPNGKAECSIPAGIGFATAISRSIVTGSADADATATAVGDVVGDIFFA
jgi:hypothetical protein